MSVKDAKPFQPSQTNMFGKHLPILPNSFTGNLMKPQTQPLSGSLTVIPWRLALHIGSDSPAVLGLEVSGPVVIGRSDPALKHTPQVDLGSYEALDLGVSRKHAKIFVKDGALYVQDYGSTNGTRLNGTLLDPHNPYRFNHGDTLDFGKLHAQVHVLRAGS